MKIAKSPIPEEGEELPELGDPEIHRFIELVNQGIEAWAKAGAILVQMVDRNPNAYKLIMAKSPHISVDLLLAFERIGRRKVYPYLLMERSAGAQRLLNFPYAEQEKLFHNPKIKFVLSVNGGKHLTTDKSIFQLSHSECDQAIVSDSYGHRIRTPEEQVHYLKMSLSQPTKSPARLPSNSDPLAAGKTLGIYRLKMRFGKLEVTQLDKHAKAQNTIFLSKELGEQTTVLEIKALP